MEGQSDNKHEHALNVIGCTKVTKHHIDLKFSEVSMSSFDVKGESTASWRGRDETLVSYQQGLE